MEYLFVILMVLFDIYVIFDFIKPFMKREYLKGGFRIKLISSKFHYIISFLIFIGAAYILFVMIEQRDASDFIFFNVAFVTIMFNLSKSYIIFCDEGLFLDGTFYSNKEKQEGQYVDEIITRRIYAIRTPNKYSYVFLSKKYIDVVMK